MLQPQSVRSRQRMEQVATAASRIVARGTVIGKRLARSRMPLSIIFLVAAYFLLRSCIADQKSRQQPEKLRQVPVLLLILAHYAGKTYSTSSQGPITKEEPIGLIWETAQRPRQDTLLCFLDRKHSFAVDGVALLGYVVKSLKSSEFSTKIANLL